jgi:thiamine biosynthesis lipoprotein
MLRRSRLIGTIFSLALALSSVLSLRAGEIFAGRAMGMAYRIEVLQSITASLAEGLHAEIVEELARLEEIFSLHRPDSELARWNGLKSIEPVVVSEDIVQLVKKANQLRLATEGAFDPTVRPLLDIWKLNEFHSDWSPPDEAQIEEAIERVGLQKVEWSIEKKSLRKRDPRVALDLNALVEGWAIDRLALKLRGSRLNDFLIQLGGEYYRASSDSDSKFSRIAVESPIDEQQLVLETKLANRALSVSGNYRNGRAWKDHWYSHLIDARTGKSSRLRRASVAVTADTAFEADGWATALMLCDLNTAQRIAKENKIAACFLDEGDNDLLWFAFSDSGKTCFKEREPERKVDTMKARVLHFRVIALVGILLLAAVVLLCKRIGRTKQFEEPSPPTPLP